MLRSVISEVRKGLRDRADRRDLAALVLALPGFDAIETMAREARGELGPAWQTYVTTVSTPVMAASLEFSGLIMAVARILRPRRIMDTGSGFTSYVLRKHAREAGGVTVVTADDSPEWLGRTRAFLASNGLTTDEMWVWDSLSASSPEPFDFVVHDLGNMSVREAALPRVLELAAPNGVLVLDDLNTKALYHDRAPAICRRAGRRFLLVRALTLDIYGRYGAMVLPC